MRSILGAQSGFLFFFFRRLFTDDDDERESVNIKRRFHGLLWKGSARRFEKWGAAELFSSLLCKPFGKHILWVMERGLEVGEGRVGTGVSDWRACLNMKGTLLEATWANAAG